MTDHVTDLRPHEVAVPLPGAFDASIWFIGRLRTPWTDRSQCPRRGDPDSGPDCRVELDPRWIEGLAGVEGRERIQLLYWMHLSRRDLMRQNPNFGDASVGTFSLRSPVRPNPIAATVVRLLRVEGAVLHVRGLDCVDGTPLVDIKGEFGAIP